MRGIVVIALAACSAPSLDERSQPLGPDPRFEIRISETTMGANGHTKREVLVFGTKADGTFSTDDVVVGIDRPAGTFIATNLRLGPHGATTWFTPCDAATAGCTGAAKLTVARAGTIVATADIDLVTPTHVSSAAACAGNDPSVVFLDGIGNDYIRNGTLRIVEFAIGGQSAQTEPQGRELSLTMTPRKATQGNNWRLGVDSYKLAAPLAAGIYPNATRPGSQTPSSPGLYVSGNARGCNTVKGAFEIHELVIASGVVQRALVSFEQHCEGSTTSLLEGCFRYAKP